MRFLRYKSIIAVLTLLMVFMITSVASAAVKTGFYVKDADKVGQEYTYYSLPYILDSANFNNFLTYKDAFTNDNDFIWVDSQEQFVSIADWNKGPIAISNPALDLGSTSYYDAEIGSNITLSLTVEPIVSNVARDGFDLILSRAVAGLLNTDLIIKDSRDTAVGGVSITNALGDNINFQVACNLIPGESYTLTMTKAGFDFAGTIVLDIPTEIITLALPPVTSPTTGGFTLNLVQAVPGLVAGDFVLADQYGVAANITGAATTDGGATYQFTAVLIGEETYTLTCPGDRYELSAPVEFTVPPIPVDTTIKDVTVNDLVVNLDPGVNDIPSASFILKDSNDQRVISMIVSKNGDPTTDYKIGVFPYLSAGAQYSVKVFKRGYDFGSAKPLNATEKPIEMNITGIPTTNGFSVTMTPAVPGLIAGNFSLKDSQNTLLPFAVSTNDGGLTYNFRVDIAAGTTYTIAAVKNGFDFGTAKSITVPVTMIGAGGVNGSIYVYLNGLLPTEPAISEFVIERKIDSGVPVSIVATKVSQDTIIRMLTITVPQITVTGADQTVTETVTYGGVTKTYTYTVLSSPKVVADAITDITAPDQDATGLALPTVPAGFTVSIFSSDNEAVIAKDGTITPPVADTIVAIVLQVKKTSTNETANTVAIDVEVPGSPNVLINTLTIANPAPGATELILPGAVSGYTMEITSVVPAGIIALDGSITLPWEAAERTVTLEVTKTKNGSKAARDFTVAVPQAPAVTALNSAQTNEAIQSALINMAMLGLNLEGYNNLLNDTDRLTVAQGIINARPAEGYKKLADLQVDLDNAVANLQDLNDLNAAVAALTFDAIKGTNTSADAVTTNLDLPATVSGVAVAWTSDKPAVIAVDGTVVRPSFATGDQTVVLTANLSKETQTATKVFTLTVIKKELVATPTAVPTGSQVEIGTKITLTSSTAGAAIYYTLDGSVPTAASLLYSDDNKPTINGPYTLKAIAIKAGMTDSAVLTEMYTIPMAAIFDYIPGALNFKNVKVKEVAGIENAAKFKVTEATVLLAIGEEMMYLPGKGKTSTTLTIYDVDGNLLAAGEFPYPADAEEGVVIELAIGLAIPEKLAAPVISPAAGEVAIGTEITLSTTTVGAKIYYTEDGTIPTTASTLYDDATKPVINKAKVIKAQAFKDGMLASDVTTASYTVPKTAIFDYIPGALNFKSVKVKEVAGVENAAKFKVTEATVLLAIGEEMMYLPGKGKTSTILTIYDVDGNLLAAGEFAYPADAEEGVVIELAIGLAIPEKLEAPVANPAGGEVAIGTEITLSTTTAGTKIYYTEDGTIPTTASNLYDDASKPVINKAKVIKAQAFKDGMLASDVTTASYTVPLVAIADYIPGALNFKNIKVKEVAGLENAAKFKVTEATVLLAIGEEMMYLPGKGKTSTILNIYDASENLLAAGEFTYPADAEEGVVIEITIDLVPADQ